MIEVKHNIDSDLTINGRNAEEVLHEICAICHAGLFDASDTAIEAENNPYLNNAKHWKSEVENLEGKLCRILDLLGD